MCNGCSKLENPYFVGQENCDLAQNPIRKYDVYVRYYSSIKQYDENNIERYRVRHKYLNEEELKYQNHDDFEFYKKVSEFKEMLGDDKI